VTSPPSRVLDDAPHLILRLLLTADCVATLARLRGKASCRKGLWVRRDRRGEFARAAVRVFGLEGIEGVSSRELVFSRALEKGV
jgi:hypothetical protein